MVLDEWMEVYIDEPFPKDSDSDSESEESEESEDSESGDSPPLEIFRSISSDMNFDDFEFDNLTLEQKPLLEIFRPIPYDIDCIETERDTKGYSPKYTEDTDETRFYNDLYDSKYVFVSRKRQKID
jgi:hypothetical protein